MRNDPTSVFDDAPLAAFRNVSFHSIVAKTRRKGDKRESLESPHHSRWRHHQKRVTRAEGRIRPEKGPAEVLFRWLLCAGLLAGVLVWPVRAQRSQPELWYWHHSALKNTQAVQSSKALIDKAFSYGYTGVAFWDPTFEYISYATPPDWDANYPQYMKDVMNYAVSKGMKVMAQVAPFGYSNDILRYNPNWAEAQRVVGTQFQVD